MKCFGCELKHPVDDHGFHQGKFPADVTSCRRHPTPPTSLAVCEKAFYALVTSSTVPPNPNREELIREVAVAIDIVFGADEATLAFREWFRQGRYPFPIDCASSREIWLLADAIFLALAQVPSEIPTFVGMTAPEDRDFARDPFWFTSDCGIAAEVFETLLGKLQALLGGYLLRTCPEGPIREALVKVVVGGLRQYLRLLASHPNVDVPETLMPRHERLDLLALTEQRRQTLQVFEQAVAEILDQIEVDGFSG